MAEAARAAGAVGRLLRKAEASAYWLVVAPLAAFLPARLAYRLACWRGDWTSRSWPEKHSEFTANLRQLLGEELSPEKADRVARDIFRFMSCEAIDVMRLRGRARSLGKLFEIRGREHLEAALAGGKGAVLCSPHFSSHPSAFSVLHASGFPFTTIGRCEWRYDSGVSSAERRFWEFVYARRLLRHQQRPNIEPWPGRVQVAVQAAAALRANEVVSISSDTPPLYNDLPRAVEVPFLGRQAMLLPGVVTLARLSGAPVLMVIAHHSADYYHQVLEISPPVPMDGDTNTAFRRCVAAMDAAIRSYPAEWTQWETEDLSRLGLLRTAPAAGTSAVSPQPATGDPAALLEDRRLGAPATTHESLDSPNLYGSWPAPRSIRGMPHSHPGARAEVALKRTHRAKVRVPSHTIESLLTRAGWSRWRGNPAPSGRLVPRSAYSLGQTRTRHSGFTSQAVRGHKEVALVNIS